MAISAIIYYDWVPFFNALCREISAISKNRDQRDRILFEKAKDTFEPDHPILKYSYVDPFSYLYALAQKNTVNQRAEFYERAKQAFGLTGSLPTDWIFPTPTPIAPSLFYDKGQYTDKNGAVIGSDGIWDLFDVTLTNAVIDAGNFRSVLSIKKVGVIKLTQVLFLVNPVDFIPFDSKMNSLPLPELSDISTIVRSIEKNGLSVYQDALAKLKGTFAGCAMYEVNLLNVLLNGGFSEPFSISDRFCQVSSWVNGQDDADYFDDFVNHNAVWTGGKSGSTGAQEYPLTEFNRGDLVLVRRGIKQMGGIGVILQNDYQPGGFNHDASIKIIWLVKENRKIDGTGLGQWIGFAQATAATIAKFRELYPDTFNWLNKLNNTPYKMINHSPDKYKNIILYGPPGTGKTRLAKQIAAWLVSDLPKEKTLVEMLDATAFTGDPDIDDLEEVQLIQFHPSYTYEDFVRGITTQTSGGQLHYKVENKVLATIAEKAIQPENQHRVYVLIIDEINRANLPAVLGELIYALEYRGRSVTTMYPLEGRSDISLPPNLYIIGTMNTADRSVTHVDYAIRRRFLFFPVLPDGSVITGVKAKALFLQVRQLFDNYTSSEFNKDDISLGHSYFLVTDNELPLHWKFAIRPILLEYIKDGILLQTALPKIKELDAR